ncbi:MAG TPA: nucleotide exchange factor GrpE [Vicinamibacterales bacterium]|nr:nucleotide exchange factor GrpE [Vicinamibacterales bacterium]
MNDTNESSQPEPTEAATANATVEVDELQRQRDDYYDRLLRKTAEFDNYRKRVERDRQSMAEAAAADLVRDLLPLVDDLERALKADVGAEGAEAYRRGVELIHRQLLEVLRKRGVRPIDALGADFDPHYHEAVAYEPTKGRREGEIIEEFGRGYMLGDRLVRPAMVKVAKGE